MIKQKYFWPKLANTAFLLHIALIVLSILEVAVYAYLIDPGHDWKSYEAHAQSSGPWVSGIGGALLVFMLARNYIKKYHERQLLYAIALPAIYVIMDVLMLLPFNINWVEHLPIFLIANGAKVAAAFVAYFIYNGSSGSLSAN